MNVDVDTRLFVLNYYKNTKLVETTGVDTSIRVFTKTKQFSHDHSC